MWQWDSEPILRHQRTLSKLALLVRSNILPEDDLFMVELRCDCMGVVIVVMVTDLQRGDAAMDGSAMRSHPGRMEGG